MKTNIRDVAFCVNDNIGTISAFITCRHNLPSTWLDVASSTITVNAITMTCFMLIDSTVPFSTVCASHQQPT